MYLNYLAYGSNLYPRRMRMRVPSARVVDTVELKGWQLRFHKRSIDGSGKCNLLFTGAGADRALGVVYEIPLIERAALDQAEGLGSGYLERSLVIDGIGKVFYYAAEEGYIDDTLVPYCWYRDYVLRGAMHHGFPQPYIEWLQQHPFTTDNNQERRHLNQKILGAAE